MADGNYEPPRAPLKDSKEPERRRSNLLAIILGAMVDFVSTQITGVLLVVLLAVAVGGEGVRPQDLQEQFANSAFYNIIATVLGLSCSVLGGYVTARFANQNEYANGLACGIVGVVTSELMYSADTSVLMHLVGLLTIPACVLGAHVKMRRSRAQ